MRRLPLLCVLISCGGEIPPTVECLAYVECLQARDESLGRSTDAVRFEAGGACWDSHESAEFCTPACGRGLDWLREVEADTLPEACLP